MIYHFLSRIGVEKYLSSRYFSSWLILGIDALLSVFATFIAYLLVRGLFPNPVFTVEYGACLLAGSCLLSVISFVLFRTFRSIIRHSTLREVWKLGAAHHIPPDDMNIPHAIRRCRNSRNEFGPFEGARIDFHRLYR